MIDARDKPIVIIVGHYGSGKSEFSVNYAIKRAQKNGQCVYLADLDIVNLYFRATEAKKILSSHNISLIESTVAGSAVDLPSLNAHLPTLLKEKKSIILDVGGNGVGAKILQQYSKNLQPFDYDMFLIINANRSETQTVEGVMRFKQEIEEESGLQITGLVNNTHLLKETTVFDVKKGHKLAQEVSKNTGLPIKYDCALEHLAVKEKTFFPLTLYLRTNWMT